MSSVKDLVHARASQYTSNIIPLCGVTDCLHLKTTFKILVDSTTGISLYQFVTMLMTI